MNKKILIVAIIGAPNAGKSTLINKLVGQKIAIVTSKCQTTRFNTKGIVNVQDTQIIFIDTPGLFNPEKPLEHSIVKQARLGLDEADRICFIIEAQRAIKQDLGFVLQNLKHIQKPVDLILNKIDLIKNKEDLLHIIDITTKKHNFESVFMISAKKNRGLEELTRHLQKHSAPGEWIFDTDTASNITDRKFAEEVTREHLYYALGAELPYSVEVQTELWEEKEDGSLKIHQLIHILKDSQKKILLGTKGQKIKSIGQKSREQLSQVLGKTVHLFLYVKVKPDWVEKTDTSNFIYSQYSL